MTEFRDRLAEALDVRYGSTEHWADHLIEFGVVADPTELAELRKYVAGVKNAHTARQADAWDEGFEAQGEQSFDSDGNPIGVIRRNPYRRAEPEETP